MNKIEQYLLSFPNANPQNLYLVTPDGKPYDSTELYKLQNLNPGIITVIANNLQVLEKNPAR